MGYKTIDSLKKATGPNEAVEKKMPDYKGIETEDKARDFMTDVKKVDDSGKYTELMVPKEAKKLANLRKMKIERLKRRAMNLIDSLETVGKKEAKSSLKKIAEELADTVEEIDAGQSDQMEDPDDAPATTDFKTLADETEKVTDDIITASDDDEDAESKEDKKAYRIAKKAYKLCKKLNLKLASSDMVEQIVAFADMGEENLDDTIDRVEDMKESADDDDDADDMTAATAPASKEEAQAPEAPVAKKEEVSAPAPAPEAPVAPVASVKAAEEKKEEEKDASKKSADEEKKEEEKESSKKLADDEEKKDEEKSSSKKITSWSEVLKSIASDDDDEDDEDESPSEIFEKDSSDDKDEDDKKASNKKADDEEEKCDKEAKVANKKGISKIANLSIKESASISDDVLESIWRK